MFKRRRGDLLKEKGNAGRNGGMGLDRRGVGTVKELGVEGDRAGGGGKLIEGDND